jgi:hypothetical protein
VTGEHWFSYAPELHHTPIHKAIAKKVIVLVKVLQRSRSKRGVGWGGERERERGRERNYEIVPPGKSKVYRAGHTERSQY